MALEDVLQKKVIQSEVSKDKNLLQNLASPLLKGVATLGRPIRTTSRVIGEQGIGEFVRELIPGGKEGSSGTKKIIEEEKERKIGSESLGYVSAPVGSREALGVGLQLGAYLIPAGRVTSVAGGAVVGASVGLLSSAGEAIEEGKSLGETAKQATIGTLIGAAGGATLPLLAKGAKSGVSFIRKSLSKLSGYPEGVVERALSKTPGTKVVLDGREESLNNIIKDTIKGANKYRSDLVKSYGRELNKISSLQSLGGKGQTASRAVLLRENKNFISATNRTLRKFGIGVRKGGELVFERPVETGKASSQIISSSEMSNIQKAYNELLKIEKDTSVKNVDKIAQNINALIKFDTPKATRTSVVISGMSDKVDDFIKTSYPDLGRLRDKYAVSKSVLSELESVFGKNLKPSTDIIRNSTKRVLQIFNEGELPRRMALESVGPEFGQDIVGAAVGQIIGREAPTSAKVASFSQRGILEKIVEAIPRAALKAEIRSNPSKLMSFINTKEGQIISARILGELIEQK
jgi:hypothetical protein